MKQVVFIIHVKDAERLIASGDMPDEVYSLCPAAAYILRKAGHIVATSADYYGSLSHARTVIQVTRQLPLLVEHGRAAYGLDDGEVSGFRANLIYILNWSYYMYYATRHYKRVEAEFILNGQRYGLYGDVFEALLRETLRKYNLAYENTNYSGLHYHLATLCNRLTLALSRARSKLRILHFGDSALVQIEQALEQKTDQLVTFKPRALGKTMAQTLHITLANCGRILRGSRDQLHYFRLVPPAYYMRDFGHETADFKTRLDARAVAFPMTIFRTRVVDDSGWYMPFFRAQHAVGANLAKEILPHLVMTNKGKYHFIRSAVYHTPREQGVSILINHGTHTAQPAGSISQLAANLWASDDRICLKNITYVIPKLPLTEQQVREIYAGALPEFIRIPTVKRITRRTGDPAQNFRIVFAGNYFGPLYHIPWCAETADEFLLGILQLIEEIGGMDGVEFIIRLKARKASTHVRILQDCIDAAGLGRNVRIDTASSFNELLETAHLLVSNLSTTVEEAISNGIPLLLHSYRKHYFHVPCAFSVAADGSSGRVYGVKKGAMAAPLIEDIRRHYAAIAASPAASLAWREDETNNLQDIITGITKLAGI